MAAYQSLAQMRRVHAELVEGRRENSSSLEFLTGVANFIRQGTGLGVQLDASKERQAAQSMLDYWENILSKTDFTPIDPTLAEFDPTLAPELADSLCPYLGLDAFREGKEALFFGRQRSVTQLVDRLESQRLLAVVGPSGSGKSSVVQAGLLPRLGAGAISGSDQWLYYPTLVPGSRPLVNLARAIKPDGVQTYAWIEEQVAGFKAGAGHLTRVVQQQVESAGAGVETAVLTIDQFEEIFTLCQDDSVRQTFINNLLHLIQAANTRHVIILTMRSDFEAQVARLPEFHHLFEKAVVPVASLNASELRDTIEKPAELVGLKFEDGVVDALLKDILGEPAALPLLQFTLLKLWEKRERNRVTWRAYQQLEGGRRALANSADAFYEALIPEEQVTVKRILLRMVRPGEGLEVTSNRIRRRTLYEKGEARYRVDQALDKLIDTRLVRLTEGDTLDDIQIEIAHEALIRNWPRLVGWLEDERERMRKRFRLTAVAEQWRALNRDPSGLWRGVLLAEAAALADLNELETEFITASQTAEQQAEAEKRAARERELAQAHALAETERRRAEEKAEAARKLTIRARYLAIVMILALIAAGVAIKNGIDANRNAAEARDNERIAAGLALDANKARDDAEKARDEAIQAQAEAEKAKEEAEISAEEAAKAKEEAEASAAAEATAKLEALENANKAEASAAEAEAQTRQVIARSLAASSLDQLGSDTQLSLLLALEAVNVNLAEGETPPLTAENALYQALQALQLQQTLTGHTEGVNDVAYNFDGTHIATASADTAVKIWDVASGQELLTLNDHRRAVTSAAFSPDDRYLATGSEDGFVILWNPNTGLRRSVLGGSHGTVQSITFSQDGALLAIANGDSSVSVWNVRLIDQKYNLFGHEDRVNDVAFTPDATQLVSGGEDGRVIIWNLDIGISIRSIEPILGDDGKPITANAIAISPDGEQLLIGYADGTARVRDFTQVDYPLLFTLTGHASSIWDVAFSPAAPDDPNATIRMMTASADGTVKVWNRETGRAEYTLLGHGGGVSAIAFNPASQQFATAGQDSRAKLWNIQPSFTPTILTGHTAAVLGAAVNGDGTLVATGSGDATIKLWNAVSGDLERTLTGHNAAVNDVAYSPDSARLASAGEDHIAYIWDLASGRVLQNLDHGGPVNAVAFSPDGAWLATASEDGLARVWDAVDGTRLAKFDNSDNGASPANSVIFSPDGSQLLTGDSAGRITIWNVTSGEQAAVFAELEGAVNDMAFSADNTSLAAAGSDGTARVWDWESGEMQRTFAGHAGAVLSVAFSPDGSRLATSSADGTAKLWDTATGQPLRTLLEGTSIVHDVVFTPDGAHLATASSDRTAQIITLESVAELLERGLALAARPLTADECFQYLQQFFPGGQCLTASLDTP